MDCTVSSSNIFNTYGLQPSKLNESYSFRLILADAHTQLCCIPQAKHLVLLVKNDRRYTSVYWFLVDIKIFIVYYIRIIMEIYIINIRVCRTSGTCHVCIQQGSSSQQGPSFAKFSIPARQLVQRQCIMYCTVQYKESCCYLLYCSVCTLTLQYTVVDSQPVVCQIQATASQ